MGSVTCLECKSEIPPGAELCPDCGFNFAEAPPIRCPECSKSVVFADGICPECGFPYEALDELLLEAEQLRATDSLVGGSRAGEMSVLPNQSAEVSATQLAGLASFSRELQAQPDLSLNDLIATLGSYLEDLKRSNCSALNDLSTGVEKLLENAEKLKMENESALQGMQDVARSFSSGVKSAVESLGAKAAAIGEATAAQAKGGSAEVQEKGGGTVDYIFYISLAMLLFTALNIAVTAYVAKLVR